MEEGGVTGMVTRHLAALRSAVTPASAKDIARSTPRGVFTRAGGLARQVLQPLSAMLLDRAPRVGRASGLGLVLIAGSAALWLSTVQPLAREATKLETQVASLEAAARADAGGMGPHRSQLDMLLERLPTQVELPGIVATVVSEAAAAGLELDRGEYELTSTRSGQLARYDLSLPVRGTYPQVRRFIDGSLAAVPSLGLAGLRLERASVGDGLIDADLRFAVVVRNGT